MGLLSAILFHQNHRSFRKTVDKIKESSVRQMLELAQFLTRDLFAVPFFIRLRMQLFSTIIAVLSSAP